MSINPGFPFTRQHVLVSLSPLTPVSVTSTIDTEASPSQCENPVVIGSRVRRDRLFSIPDINLPGKISGENIWGKCGEANFTIPELKNSICHFT